MAESTSIMVRTPVFHIKILLTGDLCPMPKYITISFRFLLWEGILRRLPVSLLFQAMKKYFTEPCRQAIRRVPISRTGQTKRM